jgi:hypothetical protein
MSLFTDTLQLLVEPAEPILSMIFNKQARPNCLADITLLTTMILFS